MSHIVLIVLVVVALLGAALSFTGRAWSLQGSLVLVCVVLLLMLSGVGCGSTETNGHTLTYRLRDDPQKPKPACLYRFAVDGVLLHEGSIDECPVVPVCQEPTP